MFERKMLNSSKIFSSYRTLGFVSNHIPLSLRYIGRLKDNLAVTVVGKSFLTYNCSKLQLLSVSNPHPYDIECIASDTYLVFTACRNVIYAWRRGTELKHVYKGHEDNVELLLPFGPHLISVDRNGTLIMWDIKTEVNTLEMQFSNSSFRITTMIHPLTYLNKILLGSNQGSMQLWNLNLNKLVYSFSGWNHPITVLEQTPAIDIVAVGLSSGDIYIHNLKCDYSLMHFLQDWGPIVSISFRTDGNPIMSTGSTVGHIALWDLEKKQLQNEIRDAHRSDVTGMQFLPNEPLLITSSPDNTLKIWIFDTMDGGGRLLRFREGHSGPPLKIRFHGSSGENILSAGMDSTLRSFSIAADCLYKNLGQASSNRKVAKKKGIRYDPGILPPIVDFTVDITREKEWDNIACCHRDLSIVTTWTYDKCRMGDHKLLHQRFKGRKDVQALCVALSSCGNFALIGYNTGHIDMFNIQSGLFRGTYGGKLAHEGSVRGIITDCLNVHTVSGGGDKLLKFWKFKEKTLLASVEVNSGINKIISHKESAMIAVALDNFNVIIVDQDTKRIVRKLEGYGQVLDMTFSPDSRWLVVASMDSIIRTWDLPTGSLIDCIKVFPMCISLTMSPTGAYLASAHCGELGISVWANSTLYSNVTLHPLPKDYVPAVVNLPNVAVEEGMDYDENDVHMEEESDEISAYTSPEQISPELITLSGLPKSRWRNLLQQDLIKLRNKPKAPRTVVKKNAPFFLPTVPGLDPVFLIEETQDLADKKHSHVLKLIPKGPPFFNTLRVCSEIGDYTPVWHNLKQMSPSSIDIEIRCLDPDNGGSIELMLAFMKAIKTAVETKRDFEFIQSCYGLFLKIHGEKISTSDDLTDGLAEVHENYLAWRTLQGKLEQTLGILKFIRNPVVF